MSESIPPLPASMLSDPRSVILNQLTIDKVMTMLRTVFGFSLTYKALQANGRIQTKRGADVASANNLTLGIDGSSFGVTGATNINGIASAGWQTGSAVKLFLLGAITVKNNTAAGAGFASFKLQGGVDFVGAAGAVLTVEYDGTYWQEIGRRTA